MSYLHAIARWKIHDGRLEEFKQISDEIIGVVNDKDIDTLHFELFFNSDNTEGVFVERYPNSEALLAHLGNLGDLMGRLLAIADFNAELYGEPSEQLVNATAGLNVKVYSSYKAHEKSYR